MDEVTDSDSPAAVLPGFDFPRLIGRSKSGIKEEECRLEKGRGMQQEQMRIPRGVL